MTALGVRALERLQAGLLRAVELVDRALDRLDPASPTQCGARESHVRILDGRAVHDVWRADQ